MDKKLEQKVWQASELFSPIICLPDLVSVEVLERNQDDAPAWDTEGFNGYIPLSGLNYLELVNNAPVFEDVAFHPGNTRRFGRTSHDAQSPRLVFSVFDGDRPERDTVVQTLLRGVA